MTRKLTTFSTLIILSFLLLSATLQLNNTGIIDLNNLDNYADQDIPNYIVRNNTPANNSISDEGATLGRVLFYDKMLSVDNSTACASCHLQEFAFGDTAQLSIGRTGGLTGRHAMRLINARFAEEERFFWDERANSVEDQSTQPIQDHVEMGFSGMADDPDLDSLIRKMGELDYYQELFSFVYGDPEITEQRMQFALAQFIRSIQSFDSKFDTGRAQAQNNGMPFGNFTPQENMGKQLFLAPPQFDNNGLRTGGGLGCNVCHRAPEFDIAPNSRNNGVIAVASDSNSIDLTNTRSPSLRDLFDSNGNLNGPLMHNGAFATILEVIEHYNDIPSDPNNNNLDPRLRGGGGPGVPPPPPGQTQNLNMTDNEKDALVAFLLTLSGENVYSDEKWSDPFDASGNIAVVPVCVPQSTSIEVAICEGEEYDGYTESGTYEDIYLDEYGCDSTRVLDLTVLPSDNPACMTNAVDHEQADGLQIYPNPFQEEFQISCDCSERFNYILFDAMGKQVLSGQVDLSTGIKRIFTDRLVPNVYLLMLRSENGDQQITKYLIKN